MSRNPSPMLGGGWQQLGGGQPQQEQQRRNVVLLTLAREAVFWGGLFLAFSWVGVFATPKWGLAAVVVTRVLIHIFASSPRPFRTLIEWVAVAGVAVIVATASPTTGHKVKTPHLNAPVNVEASQTDYLNEAKEGVTNLYEQIATGFNKAAPPAKKEGR